MKMRSWVKKDEEIDMCQICKKVRKDLNRCKLPNVDGYESVYQICLDCIKINAYKVYYGEDWASDWN